MKVKAKDRRLYSLDKELIRRIVGKNSETILDILFGKKDVNEFKIAEKLGITINQARNILYRMSKFNILDSIRKKDKRKGWYTYYWTLNNIKALKTLSRIKNREIQLLQQILKSRQMKNFYICPADNIEMSEETALQYNFLCPECGKLLQPVPKEKKIKEITVKIERIKKQLITIASELERITPKPKIKKKKVKKIKKKRVKTKKKVKKKSKKKRKPKKKKIKKKVGKIKKKNKKIKKTKKKSKKKR